MEQNEFSVRKIFILARTYRFISWAVLRSLDRYLFLAESNDATDKIEFS